MKKLVLMLSLIAAASLTLLSCTSPVSRESVTSTVTVSTTSNAAASSSWSTGDWVLVVVVIIVVALLGFVLGTLFFRWRTLHRWH